MEEVKKYKLPASREQMGLWFIHQLKKESNAYNIAGVVEFDGKLNLSVLRESVDAIVKKHESLRTNLKYEDGSVYQIIHNERQIPINIVSLDLKKDVEQEWRKLVNKESTRVFSLENEPLIHFTLVNFNDNHYRLFIVMHHIIADGWSVKILIDDLTTAYNSLLTKGKSNLKDLEIQFADYAAWQEDNFKNNKYDKILSYWKNKFIDPLDPLDLPKDYKDEIINTDVAEYCHTFIDRELYQELKKFCKKNQITLYMLMMSAFGFLIYKFSRKNDFTIGTPVANRPFKELEEIIGNFVNTLPIRFKIDSNISVANFVNNSKEEISASFSNQNLPFSEIVSAIAPDRTLDENPLTSIMFVMQNIPKSIIKLKDLEIKSFDINSQQAKFDMTMFVMEDNDSLNINFEYKKKLWHVNTISSLLSAYTKILTEFVKNPDTALSEIEIFDKETHTNYIYGLEQNKIVYPKQTILERFETNVRKNPKKICIEDGRVILDYLAVSNKVNESATLLVKKGVKVGDFVGIYMSRSSDFVIQFLSVIKAGGCAVLIDKSLPEQRVKDLLTHDNIKYLITEELPKFNYKGKVFITSNLECIDYDESCIPKENVENPLYMIYTSGSTGRPKGVVVTQNQFLNYLYFAEDTYVKPFKGEYTLLHSSISFDLTLTSILLPLVSNLTILIKENDEITELNNTILLKKQFRYIKLTPSHLDILNQDATPWYNNVSCLIVGGEQLYTHHIENIKNQHMVIYNEYGPTECTVGCSIEKLRYPFYNKNITIGREIPNVSLYVLDEKANILPPGFPGELYIGGESVSNGYYNNPKITSKLFVPDHVSDSFSRRLYRSGDICRFNHEGKIEYIGRKDEQVKIRGYRIEMGEVENAVKKHPKVKSVAVIGSKEHNQLICYYTADQFLATEDLYNFLYNILPKYMIPNLFIKVVSMPLTANGKLDKKKLPLPDFNSVESLEHFSRPETEVEKKLSEIFCDVLNIDQISVEGNFFHYGGHSLMAMSVISRIKDVFSVNLELKAFFDSPNIRSLSKKIELLTEKLFVQTKLVSHINTNPTVASFGQEQLHLINEIDPLSHAYNVPGGFEFTGEINRYAFEKAWKRLIQRHEILRTQFLKKEGSVYQNILDNIKLPLSYVDLSLKDNPIKSWEELVYNEVRRLFDLEKAPLFHISLVKLQDNTHRVLFVTHHIIFDGWSVHILIRDFIEYYQVYDQQGYKSKLKPLEIQYKDYAIWQKEVANSGLFTKQIDYWVNKFKNDKKLLELPTDYPRTVNSERKGLHYTFKLNSNTVNRLKEYALTSNSTMFSLLLSSFGLMLQRYTGNEKIIVGTPVANRLETSLENLIGYFVNTISISLDGTNNPTFFEYVEKNKREIIASMSNQEVPFEKVIQAINPERTLNQNGLFQVMFVLQNTPSEEMKLPNMTIKPLNIESHSTKFDLMVIVEEQQDGGLLVNFEYDSNLFKRETIVKMSEILEQTINTCILLSNNKLSTLNIIPEVQKKHILESDSECVQHIPLEQTFSQLFYDKAKFYCDAIAVEDENRTLSYKELWEESLQLSQFLLNNGLEHGDILPIFMDRSCSFLSSMIGTFNIRGAYVPIDPNYPLDRIKNILDQVKSRVILSQRKFSDVFDKLDNPNINVIYYEDIPSKNEVNSNNILNYVKSGKPNDLSYVIFTSGSTGVPKGAMVEQKGMINHLYSKIEDLAIKDDKVIQNASQSFDISVWQNLICLLTGGSVCITNQEISSNPMELFQYQADKKVTILEVVPSFIKSALEMDLIINMDNLRWILVTGEILPINLSNKWYQKYPNVQLVNAYGPTECSDDVTHYFVPSNLSEQLISVPIGKKIINTQIYILDKNLNFVPDGVPGELYISGEGVGRGYYNNPRLTALNFIPNPYSKGTNSRLYKTGDLCRHIGNGVYQFINRLDRQIKIRGFRIELGEIEHVILQMEEIKDCVVWTFGEAPNTRLVAYYLSDNEMEPHNFKAYLSEKLPSYMVPSNFIKMENIPLSLNGKIDYKSLPSPVDGYILNNYVAPDSPLEKEIAEIMSEVLNNDNISVLSNFFDIGGYSLTATQVINKINQRRNLSIPIRTIFEKPTIKELALSIENEHSITPALVKMRKVDRNEKIPASFGQQQLLLFNKILPDNYSYNVTGAMELVGDLNINVFKSALSQIISRHEILRTVFIEKDGEFYQNILNSIHLPLSIVENESWTDIVLKEGRRYFNLNKGPLFKLTLLKISNNHYKLMVVMHHIISDEWSIGILMKEISHFYKNNGSQDTLSNLEFQYADYTNWHKNLMESGVLNKQLTYWKDKLGEGDKILEIPSDYPRKSGWSNIGKNISFEMNSISKEAINAICKENGITLYVFLLSSFGILLHKYSGMKNVNIGSPVLGRKNSSLEDLIGYFVNTVVMKLDGSDNPSFKEFLIRVKEDTLDSLSNQDVPFEKVVEALHPTRNIEQNPLFQVMFVLKNMNMEEIDFPNVEVKTLPIHNGTAKFDLMFVIEETQDGYVVNIEFDSSLYNDNTIIKLFKSYEKIIEEVTSKKDLLLSEIEVMNKSTNKMIVDEWNNTEKEFPVDKTFSQLFRNSVNKNKDKICVSDQVDTLTYSQVWDFSTKVASRLISNKIDVGSRVTLYLERSTNFLVSMIGVFHTRAAYVPIDPNYPENRSMKILEKSKSDIIITEKALGKDIEKISNNIPILYIEDILGVNVSDKDMVENRINLGANSDLSYIIFTSGSTGQPKGVMIEQKGMINHLFTKISDLNIKKDTIIQNSSQCFDISVWQNLICLLTGGNVHIVDQSVAMDPVKLFSTANKANATILEVVPSLLRVALEVEQELMVSNLRYLLVTGEILSNDICEMWYLKYPTIPLINAYGPTECSDDVTHYEISTAVDKEPVPLPIGTPLPNIRIYILDEFLKPVPIGVKGELYIGGISVGRGYLDNPRETAQAFIPDPFSRKDGERLYKSGDLCKYLTDGRIQYLGRIDHQVKIRGFRIEVSEIEMAIRKNEHVNDCVVIPNYSNNQNRLVCYYVSREKMEYNYLKDYLTNLLPSYMVPSIFIPLDKLPLTPNGKINRAALPEPTTSFTDFDLEYVEPITAIEKKVANIIAKLLSIPKIGVNNNFFDLGGHSLLVNKLVIEIEREFDYTLGFKDFFENPTVANISKLISKSIEEKDFLFSAIKSLEENEAIELLKRIEAGESIEEILEKIRA